MNLKVIKEFRDKYTNEIYKLGSIIKVSDERGKEILSSPLNVAEEVKEVLPKKTSKNN